jgi:nitrite reductase/ring-hydroxylating ferredoxin subunit
MAPVTSETDEAHPAWPSRRAAVRALGWLLAAPVPFLFASMVDRHARLASGSKRVEIPAPAGDGVIFAGDVVVCRVAGTTRVFSSRCTHLGCRITETRGDLLVCPCHGSRFRLDGAVAAGPAARSLEPLPFTADAHTGALIVHVS